MRKRQISNMHGGYLGSGVTIDWHTTTNKPSLIQVDINPLQPPTNNPPTNNPPSTIPPQIINKPINKVSDKTIAAITGLAASAVALGSYAAYKYMNNRNGIIVEVDPLLSTPQRQAIYRENIDIIRRRRYEDAENQLNEPPLDNATELDREIWRLEQSSNQRFRDRLNSRRRQGTLDWNEQSLLDDLGEDTRAHVLAREIDSPNFGRDIWSILTRYRFNPEVVHPYSATPHRPYRGEFHGPGPGLV